MIADDESFLETVVRHNDCLRIVSRIADQAVDDYLPRVLRFLWQTFERTDGESRRSFSSDSVRLYYYSLVRDNESGNDDDVV